MIPVTVQLDIEVYRTPLVACEATFIADSPAKIPDMALRAYRSAMYRAIGFPQLGSSDPVDPRYAAVERNEDGVIIKITGTPGRPSFCPNDDGTVTCEVRHNNRIGYAVILHPTKGKFAEQMATAELEAVEDAKQKALAPFVPAPIPHRFPRIECVWTDRL